MTGKDVASDPDFPYFAFSTRPVRRGSLGYFFFALHPHSFCVSPVATTLPSRIACHPPSFRRSTKIFGIVILRSNQHNEIQAQQAERASRSFKVHIIIFGQHLFTFTNPAIQASSFE